MEKENVVCVCECVCNTYIYYTHTYVYILQYYSDVKKRMRSCICDEIYGPQRHYATWNKSDRERQVLYNLPYMWNLENKTQEQINKTETDSSIQKTKWWWPEGMSEWGVG